MLSEMTIKVGLKRLVECMKAYIGCMTEELYKMACTQRQTMHKTSGYGGTQPSEVRVAWPCEVSM